MSICRFTVEHVRHATNKPFEEVVKGIERQVGRFEPDVLKSISAGGDYGEIRSKIEAMAGAGGFMLFQTRDHGALLPLIEQKGGALQYPIGKPLFAVQMTQHDIRAGLYAPLRVLIYENDEGQTCVEYDRPSLLFGQFGNNCVSSTAAMLDKKLEALVTSAME